MFRYETRRLMTRRADSNISLNYTHRTPDGNPGSTQSVSEVAASFNLSSEAALSK